MRARFLVNSAILAMALLTAPRARADGDPPPAASVEEAKRLFEQGEALRAATKYQAALEAYMKSRALVARATNTLNVAVCLHALKRYDEAYDYFEEALTKYPEAQLSTEARESAKRTMADIESKVARLDVSANVDATLVVDGRTRGKLPLVAPIRIMPGSHVVRVIRDGFASFEKPVTITGQNTVTVDAKLEPLTSAGRLRLEGPAGSEGAAVTIDGANVGVLPWEGTLAPGTHIYAIAGAEMGTGPQLANVIVGQTVKLTIDPKPLGPERRVLVEPPTAALSVDGIAIGNGRYQGRLPIGSHVIEAREDGYQPSRTSLTAAASDASDVTVKLAIDPNHPRWQHAGASGRFGLEVGGGVAFAGSFGSDENTWCKGASPCDQTSAPFGPTVSVGAVYELPMHLSIVARIGWWSLKRKVERRFSRQLPAGSSPDVTASYSLSDDMSINGFFVAAGVGYRITLGESFDLGVRVMLQGARASALDTIIGNATVGTRTLATSTVGSGQSEAAIMLDVVPEIGASMWFGSHVRATLGLGVPVAVLKGPGLTLGDTRITDPAKNCPTTATTATALDCARGQRFDADGQAISDLFIRFQPQATLGYWF